MAGRLMKVGKAFYLFIMSGQTTLYLQTPPGHTCADFLMVPLGLLSGAVIHKL
jgi:hypothetical protein